MKPTKAGRNPRLPAMKQITRKQAEKLALSSDRFEFEFQCCQAEWIQQNARAIADIETKRRDKTNFGEFPKGWKAEMLRASKERAIREIVERFIREHCKVLDGAIWLGSWQHIQELERNSA